MKRIFLAILVPLLSACSSLDSIPSSPAQTPASWLTIQPYSVFQFGSQSIHITQPSTSAIVYLLGIITIVVGLVFLRKRAGQRSRVWWGLALLLWGAGALLAGTSYEAFSYQIKCAGRETCVWTSWWEIGYLLVSVASLDAMLVAQALSNASGKWRKILTNYAIINFSLYTLIVIIGVIVPVKFFISFELLLVFGAPNIIIFLIQNGRMSARFKRKMDQALLGAWIWLVLTIAAYFLYLLSGLAQTLWAQGLWFSENDVLHIGLIVWMVYLGMAVAPRVTDAPEAA